MLDQELLRERRAGEPPNAFAFKADGLWGVVLVTWSPPGISLLPQWLVIPKQRTIPSQIQPTKIQPYQTLPWFGTAEMAQLVKHLFREHKDLGSMKSGCGRTRYNPMWGNRVRRSLGTHCPPTCPTQWAPGQPHSPTQRPEEQHWRLFFALHTHGQVHLCIHVFLYTHEYTRTNPNLPSLYSCKNIFLMECRRLHESGVVGSDDHTVFSGVCSELLWNVTLLYFVVEWPYSRDNHKHSNRLISHLLWWYSLSDGGEEPSREPLCHIWESAYVSVCLPADNGGCLPLGQLLW